MNHPPFQTQLSHYWQQEVNNPVVVFDETSLHLSLSRVEKYASHKCIQNPLSDYFRKFP